MQHLPAYISVVFAITTIITVGFFYEAANRSKTTLLILFAWLVFQAYVALSGFYTVTDSTPPRFLLLVMPPVVFIALLFITPKGRRYIDGLSIKTLTLLHVIRIPVEVVLYWLFINKTVSQLMTFEGRNFDIFSGISAPVIYYFGFIKNALSPKLMLVWNFVCLALLVNVVVYAVLSAPFPFQQLAFDQPNIAVLYFPFNWLPSCIVPLVLFSHLIIIRQLLMAQKTTLHK